MSIEINSSSVQTTQAPDLPVSQRDLWPDGAVAKKVFVMVDGYLPGYRWGGPIRSIANAAEQLSDRFEFWILTRDRDQMEHMPYPDVQVNAWNRVGKAMVYYASPDFLSFKMIRNLIAEVNPAIVYLNNFFPHDFTEQGICPSFHLKYLLLRRLGLVPQQPVIVAPRGCFSPGALEIKQNQKQAYITLSRRVGLYDGLVWQASAALEEQEIRAAWRKQINVQVAPNLPNVAMSIREQPGLPKHPGTARFVFFSRITPKKNLLFALQSLAHVKGDVIFHIYGLQESMSYWQSCQQVINSLPANIQVSFCGVIAHNDVAEMLGNYHFFLFPTRGENFGHVIFESLAAGCPVLISDQTPWQSLAAKGVGWDIPLAEITRWQATLQLCIDMHQAEYQQMVQQTTRFAKQWATSSDIVVQNRALFDTALGNIGAIAND